MPIFRPPRREPRVLAVTSARAGLAFAVLDPWEIRSTGAIAGGETLRALAAAILRLVRREKPTLVVTENAELCAALVLRLGRRGIPVERRRARRIPMATATLLYPELLLYAPTVHLRRAAILAIDTILTIYPPPRRYAAPRNRTLRRAA